MTKIGKYRKLIAILFFIAASVLFYQNHVLRTINATFENSQARIDMYNAGGENSLCPY